MSGLEVVGVVLGSIPLIISALEHYRDGIATIGRWRRYERERQSVIRSLRTERVKMQNVCEKLLFGLVPPTDVEQMVQAPFGPLWQAEAVKRKLRARLSNSASPFESIVMDMKEAMLEMMQRLGINNLGEEPSENNKSFLSKELKRAAFTISRSNYDDLIEKIRTGISDLETLTDQNICLEPKRRETSQVKLLTLLRELSIGLFNALRGSLSCTCRHIINLELRTRPSDIIYGENELQILRDLCMNMALSLPSETTHSNEEESIQTWEELRIQPLPIKSIETGKNEAVNLTPPSPSTKSQSKSVKFRLLVSDHSAQSSSFHTTISQTITTTENPVIQKSPIGGLAKNGSSLQQISDLCSQFRAHGKRAMGCYGVIVDQKLRPGRTYQIHPQDASPSSEGEALINVSLSQVLRRKQPLPPLTYADKLRLAFTIASNVVQLYHTPWLPHTLTADDISFFQRPQGYIYDNVFILNRASHSSDPILSTNLMSFGRPRDPTLLSLGFLLIEILLGISIPVVNDGPQSLEESYIAALNLLPQVKRESLNYFSAVSRCLDGELHQYKGEKDDEAFRQDMYSSIVALLKRDLEVL